LCFTYNYLRFLYKSSLLIGFFSAWGCGGWITIYSGEREMGLLSSSCSLSTPSALYYSYLTYSVSLRWRWISDYSVFYLMVIKRSFFSIFYFKF
jgi:hypothetical protein